MRPLTVIQQEHLDKLRKIGHPVYPNKVGLKASVCASLERRGLVRRVYEPWMGLRSQWQAIQ